MVHNLPYPSLREKRSNSAQNLDKACLLRKQTMTSDTASANTAPPVAPTGPASGGARRGRGRRGGERGRGRGQNRGGSSGHSNANNGNPNTMSAADLATRFQQSSASSNGQTDGHPQPPTIQQPSAAKTREEEEVEAEVCFICASPVQHNAVTPCNHRTCHICALRMRALYKNRECAHCRVCHSAESLL